MPLHDSGPAGQPCLPTGAEGGECWFQCGVQWKHGLADDGCSTLPFPNGRALRAVPAGMHAGPSRGS
eukprot:2835119-Prorocentrum_lima.AAC.1